MSSLPPPPDTVDTYKEIAVVYNDRVSEFFNTLTEPELLFVHHFRKACIPGNKICNSQMHRYTNIMIAALRTIIDNTNMYTVDNKAEFMTQVKTWLVYLWVNHGPFFLREHEHNKRTPSSLGLSTITLDSIHHVVHQINPALAEQLVQCDIMFDVNTEHTGSVSNDIRASGNNFYSKDFTNNDYTALTPAEQNSIAGYFDIKYENGVRIPYYLSAPQKYAEELNEMNMWLRKALDVARSNPQHFDQHFISSLDYLIQYFETGDEAFFNKHSIEWLQSSSRIDYNLGFIESYDDPHGKRGTFQGEVTIKCYDINKLNAMLPKFEAALPYAKEFQRDSLGTVPNASINVKIFGAGALGPAAITAAYCLPNDENIRSTYGSKQIIYPSVVGLAFKQNPELARLLMHSEKDRHWMEAHDPQNLLGNVLWDVQCILHETVGHGSGKLTKHKFVAGDNLSVDVGHSVGDEITVTPQNIGPLLLGYEHTIEELRAEIISLYISVEHVIDLAKSGIFGKWLVLEGDVPAASSILSIKQMQEKLVFGMTATAIRRMIQQNDEAMNTGLVHGDHARANCIITHYLVDGGGIKFTREQVQHDGQTYTVVSIDVCDLDKARASTAQLLQEVQRIKSTGDGVAAKNLVESIGTRVRNIDDMRNVKRCYRATVGELAVTASVYPNLYLQNNTVVANWPTDIFDQYKTYGDQWAF